MANELMNRFEMDPFFDEMARRFLNPTDWETTSNLKTDIQESDKDYKMKVDVPGVDKRDIHLAYNNGDLSLTINQSQVSDKKDEQGRIIASERRHGMMSRNYELPNVDSDHISAQIDNGVLMITLPKLTEKDAQSGQIEIQ